MQRNGGVRPDLAESRAKDFSIPSYLFDQRARAGEYRTAGGIQTLVQRDIYRVE